MDELPDFNREILSEKTQSEILLISMYVGLFWCIDPNDVVRLINLKVSHIAKSRPRLFNREPVRAAFESFRTARIEHLMRRKDMTLSFATITEHDGICRQIMRWMRNLDPVYVEEYEGEEGDICIGEDRENYMFILCMRSRPGSLAALRQKYPQEANFFDQKEGVIPDVVLQNLADPPIPEDRIIIIKSLMKEVERIASYLIKVPTNRDYSDAQLFILFLYDLSMHLIAKANTERIISAMKKIENEYLGKDFTTAPITDPINSLLCKFNKSSFYCTKKTMLPKMTEHRYIH
jgi:hypothetical protein